MSNQDKVRFNPYSRQGETAVSKRKLPHWEQPEGCYFITFRLNDSLPQSVLSELRVEKQNWVSTHPKPWSEEERSEYGKLFTKREEDCLDSGYGACHLRILEIRKLIIKCLEKFDSIRYHLECFVLMPNHVHLIWQMRSDFSFKKELKAVKGVSARDCNKYLKRSGTFWMEESYDRLIRNSEELNAFRSYIESNPTKAGLPETDYSLQLNHRLTTH